MSKLLADVAAALNGTSLAARRTLEAEIDNHPSPAVLVEIGAQEILETWNEAYARREETGRWPVAIAAWGADLGSWTQTFEADPPFHLFGYEPHMSGASPSALLAAAAEVDIEREFELLVQTRDADPDIEATVDRELETYFEAGGLAPDRDEALQIATESGSLASEVKLERFLLDWEEANGSAVSAAPERPQWFVPRHGMGDMPTALALMPATTGSECLAFYQWFGAQYVGTPMIIAALRSWGERFGARLVGHFGTMLNLEVQRPPSNVAEAFDLACEHYVVAPCTLQLPGIALRNYARALIDADRWFLHERP